MVRIMCPYILCKYERKKRPGGQGVQFIPCNVNIKGIVQRLWIYAYLLSCREFKSIWSWSQQRVSIVSLSRGNKMHIPPAPLKLTNTLCLICLICTLGKKANNCIFHRGCCISSPLISRWLSTGYYQIKRIPPKCIKYNKTVREITRKYNMVIKYVSI